MSVAVIVFVTPFSVTRVFVPIELSDNFRVQGDMTTLVTEGRSEKFSSVCKKVEYD